MDLLSIVIHKHPHLMKKKKKKKKNDRRCTHIKLKKFVKKKIKKIDMRRWVFMDLLFIAIQKHPHLSPTHQD
jgi:hypothetical protein